MQAHEIRYIILIIFPLVLLTFSLIILIYLKKWIPIWKLNHTKNKNIIKIYKILMLLFTLPMLSYNLFKMENYIDSFPQWLKISYIFPNYIWHLSIVPLSIILLTASIIKLILKPAQLLYKKQIKQHNHNTTLSENASSRRNYIKKLSLVIPSAIFSVNTIGVFKSEYSYKIENIYIKDDNLNGITITHISDIHFGSFMGINKLMFFINKVNKLKSDLIIITGDLIDIDPNLMPTMIKCLENLNCPAGAYVCLGNHEYYSKIDTAIQNDLNKIGIKTLANQALNIKYKNSNFYLMGLDYPYIDPKDQFRRDSVNYVQKYLKQTLEYIKDQNKTKILMTHHPNTFNYSKKYNIKLTLSGHTHGGQLIFGKWKEHFLTPIQLAFPYLKGHYIENNKHLYVNSGLGHWLPIRINCPVEITQITFI